jgi:hypothetical protein
MTERAQRFFARTYPMPGICTRQKQGQSESPGRGDLSFGPGYGFGSAAGWWSKELVAVVEIMSTPLSIFTAVVV